MRSHPRFTVVVACLTAAACGFPRPTPNSKEDGGVDTTTVSNCTPHQALRCDGASLVRCDETGTAEIADACALGCSAASLRCFDIDPANQLAQHLDSAAAESDIDLGMTATINTDNGTVMVDGTQVPVRSALLAQASAPTVLVFIVRGLTANDVTITGSNAFALVSNGDVQVRGVFSASATSFAPGAGRFNSGGCQGGAGDTSIGQAAGGCGGGGFGTAGGEGGTAINVNGTSRGGAGGTPAGNTTLIPLRGGCDAGRIGGTAGFGGGGGAIQLVARTRISVSGVIAANGSSVSGGGSGGGILLEAPLVEVTGSVVANGGGGAAGCFLPKPGEHGRLDATPARGGMACGTNSGDGGNGAAGSVPAGDGVDISDPTASAIVIGGYGGGGVGRIRINTAPGGFHRAGLFSPNPSTGTVAVR